MTRPIDYEDGNKPNHRPAATNPMVQQIKELQDQVNDLTLGRERAENGLAALSNRVAEMDQGLVQTIEVVGFKIGELQAKLKETISAVTKLAKGKSLGALGLPMEESWTH